jgi:hypothetical protein
LGGVAFGFGVGVGVAVPLAEGGCPATAGFLTSVAGLVGDGALFPAGAVVAGLGEDEVPVPAGGVLAGLPFPFVPVPAPLALLLVAAFVAGDGEFEGTLPDGNGEGEFEGTLPDGDGDFAGAAPAGVTLADPAVAAALFWS